MDLAYGAGDMVALFMRWWNWRASVLWAFIHSARPLADDRFRL